MFNVFVNKSNFLTVKKEGSKFYKFYISVLHTVWQIQTNAGINSP